MNSSPEPTFDRLQDALLAATLFAANPIWLGGMVIKAHAGPVRSRFIDFLKSQIKLTLNPIYLTLENDQFLEPT